MSSLLTCISEKQPDGGIKCVLFGKISFGGSKLLQPRSNFAFKPDLDPTVIACLAGRDTQEVLYAGFFQTPGAIRGDFGQVSAISILTRRCCCGSVYLAVDVLDV